MADDTAGERWQTAAMAVGGLTVKVRRIDREKDEVELEVALVSRVDGSVLRMGRHRVPLGRTLLVPAVMLPVTRDAGAG